MTPEERMYLRRMLTAHALEGILAGSPRIDQGTMSEGLPKVDFKAAANDAVRYADAMILLLIEIEAESEDRP